MAWAAVDKDGTECICNTEPYRDWVDFKWCIENLRRLYNYKRIIND